VISKFPLRNIKRVDEKILKILEGVGQQARRDPLTGIVPPTFIHGDFHNTFKLLGICGIDRRVTPVFFKIHKDKKNSTEHNEFILEVSFIYSYLFLYMTKTIIFIRLSPRDIFS